MDSLNEYTDQMKLYFGVSDSHSRVCLWHTDLTAGFLFLKLYSDLTAPQMYFVILILSDLNMSVFSSHNLGKN